MSDVSRHDAVLALLRDRPFVSVNELTSYFGVSPATIRRDIDKLSEAGSAQKVYGGIAAIQAEHRRRAIALPFSDNRDIAVAAKRAIARAASQLVRDGSIIIVHAGSTCFHFGVEIASRSVRVVTHSMPLAGYLAEFGTCHVTVSGGDLHREPGLLYDPSGFDPDVYASQFFVGALGVGPGGILESHPLLVRFVKEFADRTNEIVLLADSRKFEERPPLVALPLSRLSHVVTDDGLKDSHARMLEDNGVKFTIAEASKGVA
ncbi:DeoR/GlpR family DNA-binding transcription regulator [Roseitranquillus sediminis]|uniref:DeoR/GlpR family DNA-binding transcription regulator n=1 Tax=Roseitranquillus sediminis TaxID=2809051 RepID=UPI001D0BF66E|nr:DeoR/GlpR family DNA-binding transcription regulator [Roseitranquillus sediminis]MBM9595798.1 DeoR/GlpR transcriptional regulator [Roseitranquillus sediminis]